MLKGMAEKVRAGLLGALVALACAGQAQAASIIGKWDPAFGNPFPDLGWQGDVTFIVPDACLLLSGSVNNKNKCSDGQMALLFGNVGFYDLTPPPSGILATLSFDASLTNLDKFISVDIQNGAVVGLHADFNQWVKAQPTLAIAGGADAWFNLKFSGNCAILTYSENSTGTGGLPSDPCSGNAGPLMTFTNLSATTVPEPGSLALLLPAVGLLAVIRRRKAAA